MIFLSLTGNNSLPSKKVGSWFGQTCIGQLEMTERGKEEGEGKGIERKGEASVLKEDNQDCKELGEMGYDKAVGLFRFFVH